METAPGCPPRKQRATGRRFSLPENYGGPCFGVGPAGTGPHRAGRAEEGSEASRPGPRVAPARFASPLPKRGRGRGGGGAGGRRRAGRSGAGRLPGPDSPPRARQKARPPKGRCKPKNRGGESGPGSRPNSAAPGPPTFRGRPGIDRRQASEAERRLPGPRYCAAAERSAAPPMGQAGPRYCAADRRRGGRAGAQ
jgi:hypothetical protein